MAAKWVHGEIQGVTADGFGNFDDLLGSSVLEAALNEEVSESVDHQGVGLSHDCLDNLVFLLRGPHLELLLQEDGSLLVIVANNLVNNVLPVAIDIAVKKTSIVEWLGGWKISRTFARDHLFPKSKHVPRLHASLNPQQHIPHSSSLAWT